MNLDDRPNDDQICNAVRVTSGTLSDVVAYLAGEDYNLAYYCYVNRRLMQLVKRHDIGFTLQQRDGSKKLVRHYCIDEEAMA